MQIGPQATPTWSQVGGRVILAYLRVPAYLRIGDDGMAVGGLFDMSLAVGD
jgi:hypothetical protein